MSWAVIQISFAPLDTAFLTRSTIELLENEYNRPLACLVQQYEQLPRHPSAI